jgi:lysophospholipase L1-like esterase
MLENLPKRLFVNIAVSICSFFLVIMVLEGVFRLLAYQRYQKSFDVAVEVGKLGGSYKQRSERMWNNVGLGGIIKVSPYKNVVYDLIPNIKAYYARQWVHMNSDGFRDREYEISKPPGVMRILGIGDSVMFGQGVSQEKMYLTVLEKRLNQMYKSVKWEVINAGIPGYNTVMEVESLKEKGLKYGPDIVIIGFVGNDFCMPNFIVKRENYLTFKKSFLHEFIRKKIRLLRLKKKLWGGVDAGIRIQQINSRKCEPDEVSPAYRNIVGEGAVRNALRELKGMGVKHGFEVVFFIFVESDTGSEVYDYARELGMHVISVHDVLARKIKEGGYIGLEKSPFTLVCGRHPSPLGHEVIAGHLLDEMFRLGLIKSHL